MIQAKLKELTIFVLVVFLSAGLGFATKPEFKELQDGDVLHGTQDMRYINFTTGYDADGDYPLNFTFGNNTGGLHSFAFGTYNTTHGVFNFTPRNDEVGSHQILLILVDNNSEANVVLIYFEIANVNDPPNITWYYPQDLEFQMYENNSVGFFFNYTATDPDIPYGDSLSSTYYLDGMNVSNNQSWNYKTGYCEPSTHTVKLAVWDSQGLNDTLQWNITKVINVDRKPTFNLSNPLPNLTFPEDTKLENVYPLFPSYFNDLDYYCQYRPDNMSFSASGNDGVDVIIDQNYPFYVSFYPHLNFNGEENITIWANDGHYKTPSNVFLVNVTPVSDNPSIDLIPNQTAYALTHFRYNVIASDPEGGLLTYSDNTSLFDIGLYSGIIAFYPGNDVTGNYTINITVTDDTNLSNSTLLHLEVKPNLAPYVYPIQTQYVSQNSTFSLNVLGGDPDGDAINITINNTGFHKVSFNASSANFTFIPVINGTFNISVNVTDIHGAKNYTTFLLNVTYFNLPPIIYSIGDQVAKIDEPYELNVTAYDGNGGIETLTFYDNTTLFDINPDTGRISFTPTNASRGNYSVNISVWDSGQPPLSDYQVVHFEVTYNRPPVITTVPGNQTAWEDYPFNLTIGAYDPDYDTLIFSDNTSLFNINPSTGDIYFVPNQSVANRTYLIRVNVSDMDGGNDSVVFRLTVNLTNDPPYFDPPLRELYAWSNVTEGSNHLIYVNVSDEENDPINFHLTWINCTANNSCTPPFNLTVLSNKPGRALINFTPEDRDIGTYRFNLSITDLIDNLYWENITMVVTNTNDPPVIINITPFGRPLSVYTNFSWINVSAFADSTVDITYINISEGRRVLFNQTSYDVDPDDTVLSYQWLLDGEDMSQKTYYSKYFDYDSPRTQMLTLAVYDHKNSSSSFTWNISILDVNRPPIFGRIYDDEYSKLINGAFNRTRINSSGWVCLSRKNGSYYANGTYTSRVIDLKARDLLKVGSLIYNARKRSGTSLNFMTRGSPNNVTWGDWSEPFDPGLDAIPSGDYRYFQYKVVFHTGNQSLSPCLNEVDVNYSISNFTIKNNNIYSSVVNLQDYFYDFDPNDNLTFGAQDYEHMKVIVQDDYSVRIEPEGDYYGQDKVKFWASDGNVTTYSNLVDVNILQGTGAGSSSNAQTSSTRVLVQTQVKKEKETKYSKFKLLAPEKVTVYRNESVLIPLKLSNPTNESLLDITLNASTAIPKVNFTFTKSKFDELGVGQSVNTSLWVTPFKIAGTYEVLISGFVRDPSTNDTVKVMVDSREKGEHNASQIDTKIAFTRDLIGSHPECLELNEILSDAANALELKQYAKASSIIEKVVADCRYLVSEAKPASEQPRATGGFAFNVMSNQGMLASGGLGLLFILLLGFILLYRKT